jgi:hypothetical protein
MLNRNLHVENPTGPCDVKHRPSVSAPSGGLEGYMGEARVQVKLSSLKHPVRLFRSRLVGRQHAKILHNRLPDNDNSEVEVRLKMRYVPVYLRCSGGSTFVYGISGTVVSQDSHCLLQTVSISCVQSWQTVYPSLNL